MRSQNNLTELHEEKWYIYFTLDTKTLNFTSYILLQNNVKNINVMDSPVSRSRLRRRGVDRVQTGAYYKHGNKLLAMYIK